MSYQRDLSASVLQRIGQMPDLLHVMVGARQVGKTTVARQLAERSGWFQMYATADGPLPPGPEWIESHWTLAMREAAALRTPILLVLDEIQKCRGWSEVLKRLWDERRARGPDIRLLALGSSALLLQAGLTESLAGRFFLHRCPHWSWTECRDAFGWSLDQWLYFGGYPGAAKLIVDETAWRSFVLDSLIEPAIARDVLQLQRVTKPALLRNLFALAAQFPAQMLSYNKMLGQLQDAGNATTLAHYVKLLESAFLLSGLELYSAGHARKRGSSPKLVVWNNALVSAQHLTSFERERADTARWGRLVENAVGSHLLNRLPPALYSISYWRDGSREVDFVVQAGEQVWAIEVKSGRPRATAGLDVFRRNYPAARVLQLGGGGIPLEQFFSHEPTEFFRA